MSGATRGGFNIGTVGGNASFRAGGDMVAGDKTTQTTTTNTVNNGFKQDDDKQKFLRQIDELRAALRELHRQDRSHKPRHEANGGAQCGKSARCVRRGGDWRRGTASAYTGAPVLDPTCAGGAQ